VQSKDGIHLEYILSKLCKTRFEEVGSYRVSKDDIEPRSASIDSTKSFCIVTQNQLSQLMSAKEQQSFQVTRYDFLSASDALLHNLKTKWSPLPVEHS